MQYGWARAERAIGGKGAPACRTAGTDNSQGSPELGCWIVIFVLVLIAIELVRLGQLFSGRR